MSESNIKEIAIIGAGPAGASTAIQLKKMGIKPFLIDSRGYAGGLIENAYRVDNYIGTQSISGSDISENIKQHLESFNIKVIPATVIEIKEDDKNRFVIITNSGIFTSKIIVIAVGTNPKIYDTVEKNLKDNILYDLVTLKDHSLFNSTQKIIIIGGGESAFDYALSLAALEKDVIILVRGSTPKATGLLKKEVENHKKIKIIYKVEPNLINDYIKNNQLILSAIGRKSALDKIRIGFKLPHPMAFVIGDAEHGRLGQLAITCGEGIACANLIAKIIKKGKKIN